ncbi:MAG: TolC family protein [Alphaproteobacteria bacterium]
MSRQFAAAVVALLAGACAFSPDGGMAPVAERVSAAIGKDAVKLATVEDEKAAADRVRGLLAGPLSADAAVQVALLNNRGLQTRYNDLGLAEAAFVEAGLPPNPILSYERIAGHGAVDIERRLIFDLLGLLTLPARKDVADSRWQAAQLKAAEATLRFAADARRAYVRAVAAERIEAQLVRARSASEAAAALTRQLGETAAASKLEQARAAGLDAEVATRLGEARIAVRRTREALTRAMGLWGADAAYALPDALPPVPARAEEMADAEVRAIEGRLDVQVARHELDAVAKAAGLAEATRFVSLIELAGIQESSKENGHRDRARGFEIAIQIPIFDLGEVASRRAREMHRQAMHRLVDRAVEARSEAREAYLGYRARHEVARAWRERVLPLRALIDEEAILEYNGMLIDVIELLATVRESIAATVAAIEAHRDFLLAEIDLRAALIVGGAAGAAETPAASLPAAAGRH